MSKLSLIKSVKCIVFITVKNQEKYNLQYTGTCFVHGSSPVTNTIRYLTRDRTPIYHFFTLIILISLLSVKNIIELCNLISNLHHAFLTDLLCLKTETTIKLNFKMLRDLWRTKEEKQCLNVTIF